jgi:hypothetical protein
VVRAVVDVLHQPAELIQPHPAILRMPLLARLVVHGRTVRITVWASRLLHPVPVGYVSIMRIRLLLYIAVPIRPIVASLYTRMLLLGVWHVGLCRHVLLRIHVPLLLELRIRLLWVPTMALRYPAGLILVPPRLLVLLVRVRWLGVTLWAKLAWVRLLVMATIGMTIGLYRHGSACPPTAPAVGKVR